VAVGKAVTGIYVCGCFEVEAVRPKRPRQVGVLGEGAARGSKPPAHQLEVWEVL